MLIRQAREHLERRAANHRIDLTSLDGPAAVDLILGWFEEERADDAVPLEEDGDGILFQWGTYKFAGSATFQYDVTRQFTLEDDGERELWQLSLRLQFAPTPESAALGENYHWCFDPTHVPELRQAIELSPATGYVSARRPGKVTLEFFDAC